MTTTLPVTFPVTSPETSPETPVLLSDPRVHAIPVRDNGDPLVSLPRVLGPARAHVRPGLAWRLDDARRALPPYLGLRVVEGHRSVSDQRAIIERYERGLRAAVPGLPAEQVRRLSSRYVAPVEVAPHVAGAAVDLTLVDASGTELDLGCLLDATPEESEGRCFTASPLVVGPARELRAILTEALSGAGLVNYPTEWWHWSYGDRYWALSTGAPAAVYGPVESAGAGR